MRFDPSYPPANRIFCFDSLQENNTLQKLVLSQCGIGDVGVAALAEGLKVGFQFLRRCILKISHSFNLFRPLLSRSSLKANHRACSLRNIQIAQNPIGPKGSVALAEALFSLWSKVLLLFCKILC
jgi:hypothetical protein